MAAPEPPARPGKDAVPEGSQATPRWASLAPYGWLLFIAFIVTVADQVTKAVMMRLLPEGTFQIGVPEGFVEPITVIPGFFYLVHVTNEGAAWGMLDGHAFWLGIFGVIALAAVFHYRHALELSRQPQQWIFGLICGGILGNVIDRLRWGHVVDFLDVHLGSYRYPAFNVADSAITVGVICYLAYSWFFTGTDKVSPSAKTHPPS